MKTFVALPILLLTIMLLVLTDSPSNAQNKVDQFEMPLNGAAPEAAPAKKLPYLYVLVTDNCAPCERLKGEIVGRSERARWLVNNHTVLLVKVVGFPAVMSGNGSQFSWPNEAWERDGSPLKALTDKLGFKEHANVGIQDLINANADLVLSDFSGVAQAVQCIPPTGEPITVYGDFLEEESEDLLVDQNSEKLPRAAIVDLPRVIAGVTAFERKWKFLIDGETWLFAGFKGKDTNVQTVMLTMPGQEKFTGRSVRH